MTGLYKGFLSGNPWSHFRLPVLIYQTWPALSTIALCHLLCVDRLSELPCAPNKRVVQTRFHMDGFAQTRFETKAKHNLKMAFLM